MLLTNCLGKRLLQCSRQRFLLGDTSTWTRGSRCVASSPPKQFVQADTCGSELCEAVWPTQLPDGATIRYPHRERACILPRHARIRGEERGVSVAIIGASGNAGRQIATSLVAKRPSFAGLGKMTVQFVGSRTDSSLGTLIGLCSELRDGFDEFCPHFEVVCDLEAVSADIIVMAAGASLSHQYKTFPELARANMDIFGTHAEQLLERNYNSLIVIVSNPAEFAVDTFVDAGFHRHRVIGFGAYLDTLRFRRELASELGVSRQLVSGFCIGMHGMAMVPCWSTVKLASICPPGKGEQLERLKAEGMARMPRDVTELRKMAYDVRKLAESNQPLAAAGMVNQQPPDVRAILRRYLSFFSGPTYPRVGIGEKVSRLVADLLEGRETLISAQVRVNTEWNGVKDIAIGVPVVLSCQGARIARGIKLHEKEVIGLQKAAQEAQGLTQAVKAIRALRKAKKDGII